MRDAVGKSVLGLSSDRQQRFAAARVLDGRPGILIADERIRNLDIHSGAEVTKFLYDSRSGSYGPVHQVRGPGPTLCHRWADAPGRSRIAYGADPPTVPRHRPPRALERRRMGGDHVSRRAEAEHTAVTADVGARIRRLRRAAGMSQADLAGDGLSPSYISLVEAGKRSPSPEVLAQLAARLHCDVAELGGEPAVSVTGLAVELSFAETALNAGDAQAAREAYLAVRAKVGKSSQPESWYKATYGLARALENLGELEEAVVHLEELHATAVAQPDSVPRLTTVIALCRCYRELGDLSHAIEVAEDTLAELDELGLAPTVVGVELLSTLVGVHMERGDLHRASYLAGKAIEQADSVTDARARGAAYWNASVVLHRNGKTADALVLIEKALACYAEGEDTRALARLRNAYAMLLLESGSTEPEPVREMLQQSYASLREVGSSVDVAYCLSALARMELRLGDPLSAVRNAEEALELLGTQHRLQSARNYLVLAAAHLAMGRTEACQEAYERGALMLETSEANRQAGFAWAELAEIFRLCGEEARAVWAYRQSVRCLMGPYRVGGETPNPDS